MPWTHVLQNWPLLLDHLADDFKHLERAQLRKDRSDRVKLERHLALAHDLTLAEAAETLQDWMAINANLRRTA